MNLFKVGDRCFGVKFSNYNQYSCYNYMSCTVEEVFKNVTFNDGTVGNGYKVIWDGSMGGPLDELIIGENHLKLRRVLVERSSWDKMGKICGADVTRGCK